MGELIQMISKINQHLLDHPEQIQTVFTRLFGVHLMRYYDASGQYVVEFDEYQDTSSQNSATKTITIALKNIKDLLKANVNVLSVAYHELAHVLYTSDVLRDRIRKLALNSLCVEDNAPFHISKFKLTRNYHHVMKQVNDRCHAVWNVLEDQRIERLLAVDFKFLEPIIEPLKKTIQEDGLLMSWRKDKYATQTPPQEIVDLAEEFSMLRKKGKNVTAKEGARIVVEIIKKFYPQFSTDDDDNQDNPFTKYQQSDDDQQPQQSGSPTDEPHGKDDDIDDQDGDQDSQDDDAQDDDAQDDDAQDDDAQDDDAQDDDGDGDDNGDEPTTNEVEQRNVAIDKEKAVKDMKDLENMQVEDNSEKAILEMLKDIKKEELRNIELREYSASVKPNRQTPVSTTNKDLQKVEKVVNISQEIRNGMTAAQRKSYTSNISPKISVSRIVEAMANRKEPKVFSNKGKDYTTLKKVVIFEDVSGSTGGFVSTLFSNIAYALATSFIGSEWWLYADFLTQKHKLDYEYVSYGMTSRPNRDAQYYDLGGGTSARNLIHVMRKYRQEKAIFIVITDGDIEDLFSGSNAEIYQEFKDKTAVVGILDDNIKANMPHHHDIKGAIKKIQDTTFSNQKDLFEKISIAKQSNNSIVVETLYKQLQNVQTTMISDMIKQIVPTAVNAILPIVKGQLK